MTTRTDRFRRRGEGPTARWADSPLASLDDLRGFLDLMHVIHPHTC
jgi:hypothetical protein